MADEMWALLPAVYRRRDAEGGNVLRALVEVFGEQAGIIQDNIQQMYDNWFIETCEDWVVPYLGDLVGARIMSAADGQSGGEARALAQLASSRALVANAIRWRRRKGTFGIVGEIAWEVTRWPTQVVEFGTSIAVPQDVRLPGRGGGSLALRDPTPLSLRDGPGDRLPRLMDVRTADAARSPGRYAPSNIGIFVFRRMLVRVERSDAAAFDAEGEGYFTFDPLGKDLVLYHNAPGESEGQRGMPGRIMRSRFGHRRSDGDPSGPGWRVDPALYGEGGAIMIWTQARDGDPFKPVEPERIEPANLRGWKERPRGKAVAVDPERGRIAFAERNAPTRVRVSFSCATAGRVGAVATDPMHDTEAFDTIYGVSAAHAEGHNDLRSALERWRTDGSRRALIEFRDSATYNEDRLLIDLSRAERQLVIRAAAGCRPVIRLVDYENGALDAWRIRGGYDGVPGSAASRLVLEGLMVTGRGLLVEAYAGTLSVRHCTFVPGWSGETSGRRSDDAPSILLEDCTGALDIALSILGPIYVRADELMDAPLPLAISDSILDAGEGHPVLLGSDPFPYAALSIRRCTVLGTLTCHALPFAENSLFTGRIQVARRQQGCVRYCYVAPGSRTPRRFSCVPRHDDRATIAPAFVSRTFGAPGYGELAQWAHPDLQQGADDREELGAYHDLFWSTREARLKAALVEYLPVGVSAGIISVD